MKAVLLSSRKQFRPRYRVIRDYVATRADELSLTEGEYTRLKTKPKPHNLERIDCFEVEKETMDEGKHNRNL